MTSEIIASAPKFPRRGKWLALGGVLAALAAAAVVWVLSRRTTEGNGDPDPSWGRQEVPDGPPFFRDRTAGSGVDFTYRNGEEADEFTILESLGGGVALIDADGDGLLDLFFPGGGRLDDRKVAGRPCRFYRNLGGWKFKDVTGAVGLDGIDFYTHGAAAADYDRDGWPDLLVTGYGRLALFRNVPHGSGRRFTEVTAKAGLNDTSWSTSAGWADLTGDGYPDLYVCHYVDWSFANHPACTGHAQGPGRDVCPPQRFKPLVHALYFNKGDGTFRDVTAAQRLRDDGCGLGVVLADVNGDAQPDVYVANDATNNHLYLNRGGTLREAGMDAGVAVDERGMYNGSMGVDAADFDGTGRASLFVTNFQGELHALYQNLGPGRFGYQSQGAGLAALGRQYVGFGTAFVDVDNDGWEDLVIANGHVLRRPRGSSYRQRPLLLRNTASAGRRVFQDYSRRGGPFFEAAAVGRGLAAGDLDNDGRPDLVVSHTNGPAALLQNVSGEPGASATGVQPARWLGVKLAGKDHRDVAGSTVVLQTGGPDAAGLTRFAKGGGSYLSSGDRRIVFGLGPSGTCRRLTVKWAWGKEQHWDGLEPGAYWELREGEAAARRLP